MKYFPLLFLFGCASNLTEAEREWRHGIDRENWRLCERVYQQQGVATVHIGHSHRYDSRRPPRIWHVRDDLRVNNCQRILGNYWADY